MNPLPKLEGKKLVCNPDKSQGGSVGQTKEGHPRGIVLAPRADFHSPSSVDPLISQRRPATSADAGTGCPAISCNNAPRRVGDIYSRYITKPASNLVTATNSIVPPTSLPLGHRAEIMEPLLEGREPPSVCSRGVQTEPLQHQRKQANRKTKVSRLPPHSQFVRSRILPLLRSDDVYLDADYEEKHGIVFRRMDIFTGKTRDPETGVVDETSEVFTQLYPWEAMNQAIEGNKPWIDSNDSMEWHLKDEWYGSHDDWWKAKRTGNILQRYLSCDHMDMVEGVIGDTDWETY